MSKMLTKQEYIDTMFDEDGNGIGNAVKIKIEDSGIYSPFNSWDKGVSSLETIAREIQEAKARKKEIAKPPVGNWVRVLEGSNVRYIRDSDVNLDKAGTVLGKWNGVIEEGKVRYTDVEAQ